MTRSKGHQSVSGAKIRYPTRQAAERAVASRQAAKVDHLGRPWRPMEVYECRRCEGWHYTTTAFRASPNFGCGGWARDFLLADMELGRRASVLLRLENGRTPGHGRQVAGLAALRRYQLRGGR